MYVFGLWISLSEASIKKRNKTNILKWLDFIFIVWRTKIKINTIQIQTTCFTVFSDCLSQTGSGSLCGRLCGCSRRPSTRSGSLMWMGLVTFDSASNTETSCFWVRTWTRPANIIAAARWRSFGQPVALHHWEHGIPPLHSLPRSSFLLSPPPPVIHVLQVYFPTKTATGWWATKQHFCQLEKMSSHEVQGLLHRNSRDSGSAGGGRWA